MVRYGSRNTPYKTTEIFSEIKYDSYSADACIAGTRIPVWLLISYQRQGAKDADILEQYPQLSAADLVTAWLYAEAFPDEINTTIHF
jgi:uncharacterized protein (DUF433 family)